MKRVMRILSLVFVLTILIGATGCAAKQEEGPVTVNILSMEQAGPTVEEMNAIVAEFNENNPNTNVVIDYVSYDSLHDKITTAMASTPPAYDVFLVDDIWFAEFAEAGYIWDVSDKITDDMKKDIFEAAWGITTVNNKVYGLPWLLDEKYFYYNEELLNEAGFSEPPETWDELVEQSKVIKEKGIVEYPIVWSWGQIEASVCDWVTLLYGNGGKLVDDSGNPMFNNEIGVETLTWMVQSIDDGITNPASISYGEEDVRNVFSQGNAVFATNWVYMFDLVNYDEEESQITGKVKMSLMPAFEGSGVVSATNNGSMAFAVANESENKEVGWEYIKYLTSEDVQNRYSAHLLPVWETSYEGDALDTLMGYSESNEITVPMFKEQFPYSYVRPKVPFYPEASKTLQLALQEALTKQKTPQQALDDAAEKWTTLSSAD